MARLLHMPEVAANATEAVLQEWVVEEGAAFAGADAIATVETEKAVVDIEGGDDGVLLKRLVPGGSQVAVGAPIAVLGEAAEQVRDLDALLDELGVSPEPVRQSAAVTTHERVFVSPLARRLARDAGLAVEEIRGSGPHGRIVRADIEAAATPAAPTPAAPTPAAPTPEPPAPAVDVDGDVEVLPLPQMQRVAATRLTQSKQEAPHIYLTRAVD
ncbi:MAG: E3 binding domain-containing protein, partial [Nocardioidaceae bacterium]